MKKILVTGGHLTPALAVMAELRARGYKSLYIGRLHALEGDTAESQEKRITEELGYQFLPITTGRLQRKLTFYTVISLFKIPLGFIQSFIYLLKHKPQLILSFGGYVAVPVVISAWFLGIPTVTHEQTRSPGLANKIISYFARKICIAWEDTLKDFPPSKTIVTGNPIRTEINEIREKLPISLSKPLIYITGGSLGAHSINVVVEEILEELLTDFSVIHQCGNAAEYKDYQRLLLKKEQLPKTLRDRYYPCEYIDVEHIGWVFKMAELVISRAGANSVSEFIIVHKPAILIPLPWAGHDEQTKNAQYIEKGGGARVISQSELTGERLLKEIHQVLTHHASMKAALKELSLTAKNDADKKIADVVESLL